MLGIQGVTHFWKRDIPFYVAKFRHVRDRKFDPSLTRHLEPLRILQRDGVVMMENFLQREQVETIVAEINDRSDLMSTRVSPNIVKRNARYLLLDPEHQLPSTAAFFKSEQVNGLARAYLSKDAVLDRPAVQLKVDIGHDSIVDFFHIDEWRYLLSGFLFLTDVGPDQAPMIYLKGSHKQSLWRLPKEREFFSYYDRRSNGQYGNEESAYCGCYLPTEAKRIRERYGFEEMICTGKAGTLLMFDNLGLHRASVLREHHRLILSGYWMLPKSPIREE